MLTTCVSLFFPSTFFPQSIPARSFSLLFFFPFIFFSVHHILLLAKYTMGFTSAEHCTWKWTHCQKKVLVKNLPLYSIWIQSHTSFIKCNFKVVFVLFFIPISTESSKTVYRKLEYKYHMQVHGGRVAKVTLMPWHLEGILCLFLYLQLACNLHGLLCYWMIPSIEAAELIRPHRVNICYISLTAFLINEWVCIAWWAQ